MRMAEIRERGLKIAETVGHHGLKELSEELAYLFNATKRRPYLRRINPMKKYLPPWNTPQLRKQVRQLSKGGMSHDAILKLLPQIPNIGRISEIVKGKRT